MTVPGHRFSTIVVLSHMVVVGPAHQTDVLQAVIPAKAERVAMVKLKPVVLRAPPAAVVHVATSTSVTLEHGSADSGRDVA